MKFKKSEIPNILRDRLKVCNEWEILKTWALSGSPKEKGSGGELPSLG